MTSVHGKRILLGITGGIAAFKCAELLRSLGKAGADVRVVLTEAGARFMTPATLQALSGQTVWTDLWDARIPDNMGHIELSRDRDLIVIAPASADFMAKVAQGLADDLLSTLVLARRCPLMVAPAMNVEMWNNPATQRNLGLLNRDGVHVAGPAAGAQACGETGMGRMLEPTQLLEAIEAFFQPKSLAGCRVLVTAGPTEEPIDPVRVITNSSSGKMGFAVARAAREAGAEVTLVSGPVHLPTPLGVARIDVRTAREMFDAVKGALPGCDLFVAVAAVADYRVKLAAEHKLKKGAAGTRRLELEENPDILAWVAARPKPPFCVGFAAESRDLARNARDKRAKKRIPLIAANLAQQALGAEESALTLYDAGGAHVLAHGPKLVLARQLLAHAARLMARPARKR